MLPVEFMLYSYISENVSVNVVVKDETIWLTQKSMAELFGVNVPAINKHLNNIFAEGELTEKVVISKPFCINSFKTPVAHILNLVAFVELTR